MKRHVRDRIEQLELAASNRTPQRRFDEDKWLKAVKEVALAGFPIFRAHVIEVLKLHGAQAAEDFANLGVGFHKKVHPGREFRHEVQTLLGELGIRDPMDDPLCWCSACMEKQSAHRRSR